MLAYLVRTLPYALRAQFAGGGGLVSKVSPRVSPRQVDINLHMNQAAYAEAAELGRTDLLLRSGAWWDWRKQGVNPMVARQEITYRREIKPLRKYTIDTRLIGMEGHLAHLQSWMYRGDRIHTRVDVRLIFVGPQGIVRAKQVQTLLTPYLTQPLTVEGWRLKA